MDGKAFKASIGLVGLSGKFNVELEGTEVSEESNDILVLRSDTFPATKTIKFVNKSDLAAFVRVAPERGSSKEVEMSLSWKEVVVAKGEQKELLVSLPTSSGNALLLPAGCGTGRCTTTPLETTSSDLTARGGLESKQRGQLPAEQLRK